MTHNAEDYRFWGLFNNGNQVETPIRTLAYIIALVDTPESEIVNLEKAKFALRYLFDVEDQVANSSELLAREAESLPKDYHPQTPVMLTERWSPISALLERGYSPITLIREYKGMACASGIWDANTLGDIELNQRPATVEGLFWHTLQKVVEKAKLRQSRFSIVAMPGWSYKNNIASPPFLSP